MIQRKNIETFKITGDWALMARLFKNKFTQLTDADLKFEAGKENELIKRVELRLNKKLEEIIDIIKKERSEQNRPLSKQRLQGIPEIIQKTA